MDLALDVEGAQVTAATSFDPKFPPANILDGETSTRWTSTGVFPQEIIIQLATTSVISKVKTWTTNGTTQAPRRRSLLGSNASQPLYFNVDMAENDGNMQIETQSVTREDASFVKFKILSGYYDFISIHKVSVEGKGPRK
ncbi:hypothetical protein AeMF1_019435 [Aphanomyces euteiches]|nr:hypothetical protein AeMF1_019435 [Aphanomyces euteiches]KAH9188636.1 hypothetical protein AeNC1_009386 [Aphanomyces euteiches]